MRVALLASAVVTSIFAFASCSEDKPDPIVSGADAGPTTLDAPSVACSDAADAIYGAPGALAPGDDARGSVLRCTRDADLTKEAMQARLTAIGYVGPAPTTNARVYRISYQTKRGDAAGTASASSAIVYIPDTPRAAKLPVIVGARGSRGQAAKCAVSKFDPALTGINDDAERLIFPIVASGFAMIVPDLAGYANFGAAGNPPSAYAQALDVGRSTLDGSRALKKLFPALDDKVVLVGHSQGGHSALAALSLADSYGAAAPIVGAALYAPLWLSQRTWGAAINRLVGASYPLDTSPTVGNVSVWYHYTQAELLDGPGEGVKLFRPEHQAAIKSFVEDECWGSGKLFEATEERFLDQLYTAEFAKSVSTALTASPCPAGDAVCEKWIGRYLADRPRLTGGAAQTPLLVAYGLKDTTIPPERMRCAVDRLQEDSRQLSVCVDSDPDHGGIVATRGAYVADWIASLTVGGAAPAACTQTADALTTPCATPPSND